MLILFQFIFSINFLSKLKQCFDIYDNLQVNLRKQKINYKLILKMKAKFSFKEGLNL